MTVRVFVTVLFNLKMLTTLQLLNTFTNLGGTWPRYFVLKGLLFISSSSLVTDAIDGDTGVDYFSVATCNIQDPDLSISVRGTEATIDISEFTLTMISSPRVRFRTRQSCLCAARWAMCDRARWLLHRLCDMHRVRVPLYRILPDPNSKKVARYGIQVNLVVNNADPSLQLSPSANGRYTHSFGRL